MNSLFILISMAFFFCNLLCFALLSLPRLAAGRPHTTPTTVFPNSGVNRSSIKPQAQHHHPL